MPAQCRGQLESALGHEVSCAEEGLAVEIRFEDLDEALDLARA